MNYYKALELADDTGKGIRKFQFTQTNDDSTWAVGYCAINRCKHDSAIEASDCYRKYCREHNHGNLPGGFPLESEDGTELVFYGSY